VDVTGQRAHEDPSMPAWDKRVRTLTLHGVDQNMKLGARYFRFEVLEETGDPNPLRLRSAVGVLEEVVSHGRCVIVLPDERRVALYAVHPEEGASEIVWYERTELITETGGRPGVPAATQASGRRVGTPGRRG
jgi:hypothetical protein